MQGSQWTSEGKSRADNKIAIEMAFEKLLYIYKNQGVRRESGSNLDWHQNSLISHIYTLHCTDCSSSPLICLLIVVG